MYCSLLVHVTAYNIVVQSNVLCLCSLQCVIVVFSIFLYIPTYYSIFKSSTMYYSSLHHITACNIILRSNIARFCNLRCVIVVYNVFQCMTMHYTVFQSKTMYYSLGKCIVVYCSVSHMLTITAYNMLQHIT